MINTMHRYGLIGKKLGHSYSEQIHKLFGNNEYAPVELDEKGLDNLLSERDFCGFNVTIPYKKTVIPYCDFLSDAAKEIGSINTLTVKDGKIYGDNTDLFGFLYMLERANISLTDKNVLILGTGGTSLTAAAAAKKQGAATVSFATRTQITESCFEAFVNAQVVINTTPVGMFPSTEDSPIDLSVLPKCEAVVDVIYNPLNTRLLIQARKLNLAYTNGLTMLVAQAALSHSRFFGGKAPERSMIDNVVDIMTSKKQNIVLTGMSGSGKTTLGAAAAAMSSRIFIDTDKAVEALDGRSIPKIFAQSGEAEFRRLESGVIAEAARLSGAVIATGGGALLRDENYQKLKQNGIVVWLDRSPEQLETCGRPLTPDKEAAKELYEARKPLYKAVSDIRIDTSGEVGSGAISIALASLLEIC